MNRAEAAAFTLDRADWSSRSSQSRNRKWGHVRGQAPDSLTVTVATSGAHTSCGRLRSTFTLSPGGPSVGLIEYLVVAFPGNKFKGEIIPALPSSSSRTDPPRSRPHPQGRGTSPRSSQADLDPEDEAGDVGHPEVDAGLLNEDDIALAAESPSRTRPPACFENVWATRFAEAVRNADGQLIANERIPYDVVQAALAYAAADSGEES